MKKLLAIREDTWRQHRISSPLQEPWTGDECDRILSDLDVSCVEELRGSWFGEYRFAVYDTHDKDSEKAEFVYLATYDPQTQTTIG